MPKGSAAKLKNMTDEERVLYMEQKMLLEAEARKKKEDLLNELLKVSIQITIHLSHSFQKLLNVLFKSF